MEYHARHPERFKYVGPDTEEVSIDGFEEYVVGKNPNLSTTFHKGRRRLRDPWDDPVCFVMSRGDNEKIVARGMRSYMLIGGSGGLHYNPFGLGMVRFACKAEERNELGPTPIIVFRNSRAVGGK